MLTPNKRHLNIASIQAFITNLLVKTVHDRQSRDDEMLYYVNFI